ncbi:DUF928 domain-containing protein [Anabaena sphaerica FACHB-251]|uniref:DUF928 domain-containing protein n=2 Tax=Anabaena TaxID=1163 RepID=A0A927A1Z6_9NOST|nr:DUF928 domain-containing protein [Anabaena sphaerica FACHB-251]
MNLQKYINSLFKIAIALSPSLIIISTFSLPSLAQPTPTPGLRFPEAPNRDSPERTGAGGRRIQFPSGQDRGKPQRTGAGGRRGRQNSCIITDNGQPSLTALMPTSDNQGQTVVENPKLYVYVPKTTTQTGEFVVIDDEGNEVYETNFTPPTQPGIVQLSIPTSASLKTGKKYFWYFTLICNSEDRSQDEYVSGSLERTTLGSLLNSSLQQATPLKKAEIYAKNKIWYETISNVASLRTEDPEVWTDLLKSVGLEDFAQAPFVDFGKPKP